MPAERIPQTWALRFQLAAIAGNEPASSFVEVRPLEPDGRIALRERAFLPVHDVASIVAHVHALAPRLNVFLGVSPRVRECGRAEAVERCWCLWADCDGRPALKRLAAFRPVPSIVVRSGSLDSAHAYWPLRQAVSPEWAQRANRRIARALGADMHATDPSRVLRPVATLNHKSTPPRPVHCTRLELDVYTLPDVVGRLPDSDHYRPRPVRVPGSTPDPSRLVAGLAQTVAEAQQGNRNSCLYWAACRVAERAELGELDAGEAAEALRGAALRAGLTEHEITATLRSAIGGQVAA